MSGTLAIRRQMFGSRTSRVRPEVDGDSPGPFAHEGNGTVSRRPVRRLMRVGRNNLEDESR